MKELIMVTVSQLDVSKLLNELSRACTPGYDSITAEHLIYGQSDLLHNICLLPFLLFYLTVLFQMSYRPVLSFLC